MRLAVIKMLMTNGKVTVMSAKTAVCILRRRIAGGSEDDMDTDIVRLCDLYECRDCPRFADDCDGFIEFEEFDDGEDEEADS